MSSTPPDSGPDNQADALITRRGRTTLSEDLAELERTDPVVRQAAERLAETMKRISENIHQVYVSPTALRCTLSCSGPVPHMDEYRAADVRPSAEATATRKAHDEV